MINRLIYIALFGALVIKCNAQLCGNLILNIGIRDSKENPIKPGNKNYEITFYRINTEILADTNVNIGSQKFFKKHKSQILIDNENFYNSENDTYTATIFCGDINDILAVVIKKGKERMVVFTQKSLAKLVFKPGIYFLFNIEKPNQNYTPYAFSNISFSGKAKLKNNSLNTSAKINNFSYTKSKLRDRIKNFEDTCVHITKTLETYHGGQKWAQNTCPVWQEKSIILSEIPLVEQRCRLEIDTKEAYPPVILPINNTTFIKHAFLDSHFTHLFSLSNDSCKSWNTIIEIKNEWYVNIVYFIGESTIAIECDDYMLLSSGKLDNWEYYERKKNQKPINNTIKVGLSITHYIWDKNELSEYNFY